LLAPFIAALFGAGAAHLIAERKRTRLLAPVAIAAGVAAELAVLGDYASQLTWLAPVLIVLGTLAAIALLAYTERTVRIAAVAVATGALMIAPGVWSLDTLGHAANGTFPEGGPTNAQGAGGFGGGPGGRFAGRPGAGAPGAAPPGGAAQQLFGGGGGEPGGAIPAQPPAFAAGGFGGGRGRPGLGGGQGGFGGGVSSRILAYVKANGGGTIAVSSQSGAAASIIAEGAPVAGIGGFSGRESDVSVSWLAQEVRNGKIRWVLADEAGAGGFGRGVPGDGRAGSKAAISAASEACRRVTLSSSAGVESAAGGGASSAVLYDCSGRAAQLTRLGA
jgi:hypothetical protein